MSIVHIGIGSNIGNRQENCREAVRQLASRGVKVVKQSSMIETEPWGVADQPRFINMAVEAETDLAPENLLTALKDIEAAMGRTDAVRWGPRVIDLDILFYDDLVVDTAELKIPHPHLHARMFVLGPLSEIVPDKVHPVLGKTVRDLFKGLSTRL
jgi:2-amino-4-hydroxy-6-hydroxymethyldihydropteridine diphosphokinase